ncbi:hypothetical protein DMB66_06065 [Actinoplanes sp. ATCC 53533]|nr:hypothetical protein DMB66_06065 [Actinoplanes sp. ATCC 53533]
MLGVGGFTRRMSTQRYLVPHGYGVGCLWWWVPARSTREILGTFAGVEILGASRLGRLHAATAYHRPTPGGTRLSRSIPCRNTGHNARNRSLDSGVPKGLAEVFPGPADYQDLRVRAGLFAGRSLAGRSLAGRAGPGRGGQAPVPQLGDEPALQRFAYLGLLTTHLTGPQAACADRGIIVNFVFVAQPRWLADRRCIARASKPPRTGSQASRCQTQSVLPGAVSRPGIAGSRRAAAPATARSTLWWPR